MTVGVLQPYSHDMRNFVSFLYAVCMFHANLEFHAILGLHMQTWNPRCAYAILGLRASVPCKPGMPCKPGIRVLAVQSWLFSCVSGRMSFLAVFPCDLSLVLVGDHLHPRTFRIVFTSGSGISILPVRYWCLCKFRSCFLKCFSMFLNHNPYKYGRQVPSPTLEGLTPSMITL